MSNETLPAPADKLSSDITNQQIELNPLEATIEAKLKTDLATAKQIIDHSIEQARNLPEGEAGDKLEKLIACELRLKLTALVAARKMDDFLDFVPAAKEFVEELHTVAETTLHEATFNSDASTMVHNIGLAADIVQDKELLQELAHALEDTKDYNLELQKRACEIAIKQDELYSVTYKKLHTGKAVLDDSLMSPKPKRILSDHSNLNTYYGHVAPTANYTQADDLFHETRMFANPEKGREEVFTAAQVHELHELL